MSYTPDQINLMDKIFEYYLNYEFYNGKLDTPSDDLFAKLYAIDRDYAQTIINTICEIGHEQGILVRQEFGDGSSVIVTMDRMRCENFKNQGGFNHYFNELSGSYIKQDMHIGTNYGQIIQQGHQSSILHNENIQPKNKLSWLQIVAWIVGILAGIIGIFEFITKVLMR